MRGRWSMAAGAGARAAANGSSMSATGASAAGAAAAGAIVIARVSVAGCASTAISILLVVRFRVIIRRRWRPFDLRRLVVRPDARRQINALALRGRLDLIELDVTVLVVI